MTRNRSKADVGHLGPPDIRGRLAGPEATGRGPRLTPGGHVEGAQAAGPHANAGAVRLWRPLGCNVEVRVLRVGVNRITVDF